METGYLLKQAAIFVKTFDKVLIQGIQTIDQVHTCLMKIGVRNHQHAPQTSDFKEKHLIFRTSVYCYLLC